VIQCVWESTNKTEKNIHEQCGKGVENILREAILKKTIDNITVVVIGFSNFKKKLFPRISKEDPKKSLSKANNSIDTNYVTKANNSIETRANNSIDTNVSTYPNSTDYSRVLNSDTKKNANLANNKQIPEPQIINSVLEKSVKNTFNPFINSPLSKQKPEFLNNLKTNSISSNPLLNYKSTKIDPIKKKEKNSEENTWEIRKDILNGKITMK